jgi:hypothetical protein
MRQQIAVMPDEESPGRLVLIDTETGTWTVTEEGATIATLFAENSPVAPDRQSEEADAPFTAHRPPLRTAMEPGRPQT